MKLSYSGELWRKFEFNQGNSILLSYDDERKTSTMRRWVFICRADCFSALATNAWVSLGINILIRIEYTFNLTHNEAMKDPLKDQWQCLLKFIYNLYNNYQKLSWKQSMDMWVFSNELILFEIYNYFRFCIKNDSPDFELLIKETINLLSTYDKPLIDSLRDMIGKNGIWTKLYFLQLYADCFWTIYSKASNGMEEMTFSTKLKSILTPLIKNLFAGINELIHSIFGCIILIVVFFFF